MYVLAEGSMYSQRRLLPHPVKTEPDPLGGETYNNSIHIPTKMV